MNDPSYGVAQPLQNHMHLISNHRYPLSPTLNIDAAYRFLSDAPMVVKQVAAMSWSYIQAPQDGSVWLEWISPRGGDYRFASDGYVWGDPESTRQERFAGYTIEVLSHAVGYRPQYEHMATHARTRYHLIAKDPNTPSAAPDPSLWLVHYHQTSQHLFMPHQTVPITAHTRQVMGERRWLESQGRLERKEFMLHDREHWPNVTLPGQLGQQGHPGMNPMLAQQQAQQQRYPQQGWPQNSNQGPPAKRPRHSGPSGAPGSSDGMADTGLEDEENVSMGDFFDHLSQRDISMTRYQQHHRWMEEIFSSPYASSRIVPPDLGLGLMGELKGLTEGILDPPTTEDPTMPPKAKEAQAFTNLKQEQIEEFNKRVEKHMEEGQAEIEKMKREHAEKMVGWKKTKTLMQAEKRLRHATWEGHEGAVPAYRLDVPPSNGVDGKKETVEDIVAEVEQTLGVKIKSHKDVTLVEKGGLEEKVDRSGDDFWQDGQQDDEMQGFEQQMSANGSHAGISAAPPLQTPSAPSAIQTPADKLQASIPASIPQPTFDGDQQAPNATQTLDNTTQQNQPNQSDLQDDLFNDTAGMDMADTSLMDGMDLDVDNGGIDTSNIDFLNNDTPGGPSLSNINTPTTTTAVSAAEADNIAAAQPAGTLAPSGTAADGSSTFEQPGQQPPAQPSSMAAAGVVEGSAGMAAVAADDGDGGLFGDSTFDDLVGQEGDGGEVGFELDESAFGDAMHGMEDVGTPGVE